MLKQGSMLAVSSILDAVERATRVLRYDDSQRRRQTLIEALGVLKAHLVAHPEYEQSVASTARGLRDPVAATARPNADARAS